VPVERTDNGNCEISFALLTAKRRNGIVQIISDRQ
jgi:hypothetical protein